MLWQARLPGKTPKDCLTRLKRPIDAQLILLKLLFEGSLLRRSLENSIELSKTIEQDGSHRGLRQSGRNHEWQQPCFRSGRNAVGARQVMR
jgi:hypothetical protein